MPINFTGLRSTAIARPTIQRTTQEQRHPGAKQFAIDAAKLAADLRCQNVVVLDVAGLSPVCDYFVIATGGSARQMRTVIQDIAALAESRSFSPINQSGVESDNWMLADCVDVLVHVFNEESRSYYDLDNLWGDAKAVDWRESPKK